MQKERDRGRREVHDQTGLGDNRHPRADGPGEHVDSEDNRGEQGATKMLPGERGFMPTILTPREGQHQHARDEETESRQHKRMSVTRIDHDDRGGADHHSKEKEQIVTKHGGREAFCSVSGGDQGPFGTAFRKRICV